MAHDLIPQDQLDAEKQRNRVKTILHVNFNVLHHQRHRFAHDLVEEILRLSASDQIELGDEQILPAGVVNQRVLLRSEKRLERIFYLLLDMRDYDRSFELRREDVTAVAYGENCAFILQRSRL